VGQVVAPIVENLSMIYDPLKQLGIDINAAREVTYRILESFNYYKKGFETFGKQLKGKDKEKFDSTRDLRAALLTIGNVMAEFKVIGDTDFSKLVTQLQDPKADMGQILKKMVDQFLTSDVAAKIGEFIGTIIGTVLSEVSKITGFISGRLKGSNKLLDGLKKGFDGAKGTEAFKNIFKDVFSALLTVLAKLAFMIPFEAYMLAAAAIFIPAAIQGLAMSFAERMVRGIKGMFGIADSNMQKSFAKNGADALDGTGGGFMQTRAMRKRQLLAQRAAARRAASYSQGARTMGAFGMDALSSTRMGRGVMSAGRGIGRAAKFVPGAGVAAGAVDMGVALASGENFGKAAAGAIGTVLGATAGSFFGPAGTVIGSIAGGMIGDSVADLIAGAFTGPSDAQREAARAQMFAAQAMTGAPTVGGKDVGPASEYVGSGIVGIGQLLKAFKFAGLEGDKSADAYLTAARNMATLRTTYQELNDEAARQKAASGGRVDTTLQAKLDASRATLAAAEAKTAAAWNKITATNKTKIDNAIVQMQTNTTKFNQALTVQALNVATQMAKATSIINASKLTPDAVKKLSDLLPPDPAGTIPEAGRPRTKADIVAGRYKGGLGDAIASEMKHKPPGSGLVIANSSETVIPAAGGYGMKDFMSTLSSGFQTVKSQIANVDLKSQKRDEKIQSQLLSLTQSVTSLSTQISTLSAKSGTGSGIFNLPTGDGVSKVISAGKMLQGMGLNVAENPAFGSGTVGTHAPGSYHYAGRAIDVTGPPALLDAAYAKLQGTNPAELLWRTAGHFDHLHVAYALGAGMPAFFGSQNAAINWEKSMVPSSVKVGSVTGNSSEGFGGGTTINGNINVTVNGSGVDDADALASMVAMKIGDAVAQARSASVFV